MRCLHVQIMLLINFNPTNFMTAKQFFLLCLFVISIQKVAIAQRATLSGYIEDAKTSERLIGVNITAKSGVGGTTTNNYGFFSLTLPKGATHISVSYLGYESFDFEWSGAQDTVFTLRLKEQSAMLSEAVVTAEVPLSQQSQMSTIELNMKQAKMVPALFGEVDILRVLQFLPGVHSGNEGSTGLYVRGGGPDQNLILLDGVPLYNVSHLFGFFSVFNADAIKSTTLIKGGFPARYGGRLSSVIDIVMKDGDMQAFHGEASIGLIASKLTLEGPIVKDKTSFMISGRRTYIDVLAQPLIRATDPTVSKAGYYFGDVNLKVNHKFGEKDRLYASYFTNIDRFYFGTREGTSRFEGGLQWGNSAGALRWNHLYNPRLFLNVTATYTRYQWSLDSKITENNESFSTDYRSNIEDLGLKADWEYLPNPNNHVRFGGGLIHHGFRPAALRFKDTGTGINNDSLVNLAPVLSSIEGSMYIENDQILTNKLRVNYGLHFNYYLFNKTSYQSLQPRLSARYLLTNRSAIKFSYARMQQFLHLLSSNNGIGLPSDLWVPATDSIPPMLADQVAIGYTLNSTDNKYEFTVEAYYKTMQGIIEYAAGTSSFINPNDWQSRVETGGKGWAYGLEVLLQKKTGKNMGWIGYTLSWNNRQFENLNFGKVYPYRFDRRHDLSVVYTRQISKNFDLNATWVYGTGIATNLPVSVGLTMGETPQSPVEAVSTGDLNSYRFRPYHRGDISLNWNKQLKKMERTWNISIYNVYSRRNPFFIFRDTSGSQPVLKQVSLFPILPSISYRIKF